MVFLSGELLASLRKSLLTHKTTTVSFKRCGALRSSLGSRAHQSCHHTLWMRGEAWLLEESDSHKMNGFMEGEEKEDSQEVRAAREEEGRDL